MIVKKKDAVEQIQQYKALFDKYIGKECTITFDMHKSNGFIVKDITLRTLKDLPNKLEKVEYADKMRSPMLFEIVNNQAPIIFVFDDTSIYPLGNGIRIVVKLDKPINGKDVIEIDIVEG